MNAGFFTGSTGKGWGPGKYVGEHNPAGPKYSRITEKPPYTMMNPIHYSANFAAFLDDKPEQQPFCFWLGTNEPHRGYETDSWKKEGMKLENAVVPPFYPDNDIIRGDLLDYAVEVKWFDKHLEQAINELETRGLLDNTLIIATSDHGMPFPRVKGQIYEEGFHVPMVAYWKGVIKPGTVIDDFVSFPDIAPTFMEAAGLEPHEQMTGNSFIDLLKSGKSGHIDTSRDHVLLGKERHDTGRADETGTNLGYPVRAIRNSEFLYIRNYEPDRWPAGNPEFGSRNTDASPTKKYLFRQKPGDEDYKYYEMSFGKRPAEELYRIDKDLHCMENLADNPEYAAIKVKLKEQMEAELLAQEDPRMLGQGHLYDTYPYVGGGFDYMTGKKIGSGKK